MIECLKPAAKKLVPAPEPQLASCKGDRTAKREEELPRSPSSQRRKRGEEQRWCFMGKRCRVTGRTSAFKEISRHYSEAPRQKCLYLVPKQLLSLMLQPSRFNRFLIVFLCLLNNAFCLLLCDVF